MQRLLATLLLAFVLARTVSATTATVNYSDLWWNPDESGWGVTIDQQQATLFLMFFIYGTDNRPAWVVAQLERTGQSAGGLPLFTGNLYSTTGTWFGMPFNSGAGTVRTAGTAGFAPSDATTGTLSYTIDGVQVTRSIRRETLKNNDLSGNYFVTLDFTISCPGVAPQNGQIATNATIVHSGTQFQYREFDPANAASSCTYNGTSVQEGQLARVAGSLTCTSGATGTFTFSEITSTPVGLIGRYAIAGAGTSGACNESGALSALKR